MPKVWNKRDPLTPKDAVYCGRPSKWGNPYPMTWRSRNEVCDLFESNILPTLDVSELKGKDLVCFCAPLRCHCDSILKKANS